jgi:SpoVK/Ycf46/Vps4 family AAA+-type ATPase
MSSDIFQSLTSEAYDYYCKAISYYSDNELEGSLINFLLALNNLNNVKKYFKENSSLGVTTETAFKNEEYNRYLVPIKEKYVSLAAQTKNKQKCEIIDNIDIAITKILSYIRPLQLQLKKIKFDRAGNSGDDEKKEEMPCTDIKSENKKEDSITFNDISGQHTAKQQLRDSILNPLLYPRLFPNLSKGILFYGPPGTGKTLLAKAFVSELQIEADKNNTDIRIIFYAPKGSDLKGKYVGESEKKIAAYFKCASAAATACNTELFDINEANEQEQKKQGLVVTKKTSRVISVIFMDEIEAIAGNRDHDESGIMTTTVNALLQEMDGVNSYPNVVVMAATNYPWKLDEAILRRFDTKIYIKLPSAEDIFTLIKNDIYSKYIKPALKKPANIKLIEIKKEDEKTGDLLCNNNTVALKKYKFVDKPNNIELFDFYRKIYFPDFTDEQIKSFSEELHKSLFSGGDSKNVCMYVFKMMGKEALSLNTFINRAMINPSLLTKEDLLLDNSNKYIKEICAENVDKDFIFNYFNIAGTSNGELKPTEYPKCIFLPYANLLETNIQTILILKELDQKTLEDKYTNFFNKSDGSAITVDDILSSTKEDFKNFYDEYYQKMATLIHINYIPRIIDNLIYLYINKFNLDSFKKRCQDQAKQIHAKIGKDYKNIIKDDDSYSKFIKNIALTLYDSTNTLLNDCKNSSHIDFYINIKLFIDTIETVIFDSEKTKMFITIRQEILIPNEYNELKIRKEIWVNTFIKADINRDVWSIIKNGFTKFSNGFISKCNDFYGKMVSIFSHHENELQPLHTNSNSTLGKLNTNELNTYRKASNHIMAEIYSNLKNMYCVESIYDLDNDIKIRSITNYIHPSVINTNAELGSTGSSTICLSKGVILDKTYGCGDLTAQIGKFIEHYTAENKKYYEQNIKNLSTKSTNEDEENDLKTNFPILYHINVKKYMSYLTFINLGQNYNDDDTLGVKFDTDNIYNDDKRTAQTPKAAAAKKAALAAKAASKAAAVATKAVAKAAVATKVKVSDLYTTVPTTEQVAVFKSYTDVVAMVWVKELSPQDKKDKIQQNITDKIDLLNSSNDNSSNGMSNIFDNKPIIKHNDLYYITYDVDVGVDIAKVMLPLYTYKYGNYETPLQVTTIMDTKLMFYFTKDNKIITDQITIEKAIQKTAEKDKPSNSECMEESEVSRKISFSFKIDDFMQSINTKNLDSIKATVSQEKVDDLDAYVQGKYVEKTKEEIAQAKKEKADKANKAKVATV